MIAEVRLAIRAVATPWNSTKVNHRLEAVCFLPGGILIKAHVPPTVISI